LRPTTAAAKSWCLAHLPSDVTMFGTAFVIEPRYAEAVAGGILSDGLSITYLRTPTQH
jgi:hypothetical protein